MLTHRGAHTLAPSGVPLAMLDFVARPLPPTSPTGRQRHCTAIQLALLCALLPGASGCRNASPSSAPSRAEVRQERHAEQTKMEAAREQLEQIPPPSKNRYLSVRTKEAYGNPFLVVHPQTFTVTRIPMALPAEACCARPKPANRKSMYGLPIYPRRWPRFHPTSGPTAAWLR